MVSFEQEAKRTTTPRHRSSMSAPGTQDPAYFRTRRGIRNPQKMRTVAGALAQWLEQGTHNPLVPGSNPGGPTNAKRGRAGGMRNRRVRRSAAEKGRCVATRPQARSRFGGRANPGGPTSLRSASRHYGSASQLKESMRRGWARKSNDEGCRVGARQSSDGPDGFRDMKGFSYGYILRTLESGESEPFCVGLTDDLEDRLARHNRGEIPHMSKHGPQRIKTALAFEDRAKAAAFEAYLRTASDRAFAKKTVSVCSTLSRWTSV
jgi:putative endonuclease